MTRPFAKWSKVTNLDFNEISASSSEVPDIRVRFERGSHGDPYPFDGRGGTLAHAFYPHTNLGNHSIYLFLMLCMLLES